VAEVIAISSEHDDLNKYKNKIRNYY